MTKYTAMVGRFLSIALIFVCAAMLASPAFAQIAAGKPKFVGNVTGGSVPANFGTYWNQVTPENGSKWGSVEGTRNQMNWARGRCGLQLGADERLQVQVPHLRVGLAVSGVAHAASRTAQQRAEIEQWIQLACAALSEHLGHRRGQRAHQDGDAVQGGAGW